MPSAPASHRLRDLFLTAADAYAEPLFQHCYCRLLDRDQGKEAVQETLLRAWNAIADGAPAGDLRMLFYRTANSIIQEMRRLVPVARATPSNSALIRELSQLPPDERDAGVMRYVDGMESRDIAGIMRVSGSLIAARLRGGKHIFLSLTRYV